MTDDRIRLQPDTEPEVRIWPDGTYFHQVTVTSHWLPVGPITATTFEGTKQSAEGSATAVAAWLRAVADELDPPASLARAADALTKLVVGKPVDA